MPIYEYACRKCGTTFEHLARRLDEAPPKCPKCGAAKPEKQFSTFSAVSAASDTPGCAPEKCDSCACAANSCPFGQ